MVKKIVSGANYGIGSWMIQRASAILMLLTLIIFLAVIVYLSNKAGASFVSWQITFHQTWLRMCIQIFFSALICHAWIGVRDIWMDYIKSTKLRLLLHTLTILWLLISFIYSIKIIWLA